MRTTQAKTKKTAQTTPKKKTPAKASKDTKTIVARDETPLSEINRNKVSYEIKVTREQDQRWHHAFYHGPEESFGEWLFKALDTAAQNPPVYRLSSRFSAALKRLAHQYALDMYEIADRLMERAVREADNRIAHRVDPFEPQLIDDYDCTDAANRMCVGDMSHWERVKGMRIQEYLLTQFNLNANLNA
jgi:hypothetical protein